MVSVSPRGEALCDRVDDVHVQYWSDVLTHLPEAQRHDLARLLGQLQVAMEQEPEMRVSAEADELEGHAADLDRVRVETARRRR